jgi:hypothetical protein
MKNDSIPLFRDWSAYALSLPVRQLDGEHIRLYTLKYMTLHTHIRTMAKDIVRLSDYRG